jgi:Holliday junction DNA helicase RuvB
LSAHVGGRGLGKTTLAGVLSNELLVPLISTTGQCLATPYDLRNILVRIEPKAILLVDEFHGIGRYAAEELLIVLEEGVLNVTAGPAGGPIRIQVPPFTLCAATTYPEAISAPLAQRFGLKFRFEFYATKKSARSSLGYLEGGTWRSKKMRLSLSLAEHEECRASGCVSPSVLVMSPRPK